MVAKQAIYQQTCINSWHVYLKPMVSCVESNVILPMLYHYTSMNLYHCWRSLSRIDRTSKVLRESPGDSVYQKHVFNKNLPIHVVRGAALELSITPAALV